MPPVLHGTGRTLRPQWELADVFRLYGETYRRNHPLPVSCLQVMRAVESCRTAALGGHLERCDTCGFSRPVYNSCRNRHCPKCQALAKARWLQARQKELLPVTYFHLVFTLPHELNPLALANKKRVFDILFQAVSRTLLTFGRHELGGALGFTTILHTWDQTLRNHIHLHCAVPGGALSSDGRRWVPARPDFLFPVKALSALFRGKFLAHLKKANAQGALRLPPCSADGFDSLIASLYQHPWVVYSKPAFAGPQAVLDYFGRYTHRIAISNNRIVAVDKDTVAFLYRDRRDNNRNKVMSLPAQEFIRRFLLHVLPASFVRIRHFGFLANRRKTNDLVRCRELLGDLEAPPPPSPLTTQDLFAHLTGRRLDQCPLCPMGRMLILQEIPPAPLPLWPRTRAFFLDSS